MLSWVSFLATAAESHTFLSDLLFADDPPPGVVDYVVKLDIPYRDNAWAVAWSGRPRAAQSRIAETHRREDLPLPFRRDGTPDGVVFRTFGDVVAEAGLEDADDIGSGTLWFARASAEERNTLVNDAVSAVKRYGSDFEWNRRYSQSDRRLILTIKGWDDGTQSGSIAAALVSPKGESREDDLFQSLIALPARDTPLAFSVLMTNGQGAIFWAASLGQERYIMVSGGDNRLDLTFAYTDPTLKQFFDAAQGWRTNTSPHGSEWIGNW
jgi:hypothetical protein